MRAEHDIARCEWCRGDGRDHATLGGATVRDCVRCAGSGRVYVSSRESVTGRRRTYQGPAPRAGVIAAHQQEELTDGIKRTKRRAGREKEKGRKEKRTRAA